MTNRLKSQPARGLGILQTTEGEQGWIAITIPAQAETQTARATPSRNNCRQTTTENPLVEGELPPQGADSGELLRLSCWKDN